VGALPGVVLRCHEAEVCPENRENDREGEDHAHSQYCHPVMHHERENNGQMQVCAPLLMLLEVGNDLQSGKAVLHSTTDTTRQN